MKDRTDYSYWRGVVDTRLNGLDDAVVLAKNDLERRLNEMGEFRRMVVQLGIGFALGYLAAHAGR